MEPTVEYLQDLVALQDAGHMLLATIRKHVPEAVDGGEIEGTRRYNDRDAAIDQVKRAIEICAGAILLKQVGK